MSHITLAQQGLAAVEARDWDEAYHKLSKALESSTNPAWLIARSKALISLHRFQEALDDADVAWHQAYQRNRRPDMVDAHYRRAVAYYRMGQYANADCCCLYAVRLVKGFPAVEKTDPKFAWMDDDGLWTATSEYVMDESRRDDINKGNVNNGSELVVTPQRARQQLPECRLASALRMQALRAMEKTPADDPSRRVTVSLVPLERKFAQRTMPGEKDQEEEEADDEEDDDKNEDDDDDDDDESKPAAVPQAATTPAPAPAPNASVPSNTPPRLQEFQRNTTMSVSIFSKGVKEDRLSVDFMPSAVRLDPVVFPSGEEKELRLDLWGEIDPSLCKYTVTPNKMEISLVKKTPGRWPQLQKEGAGTVKAQALASRQRAGEELKGSSEASDAASSSKPTSPEDAHKPTTSAPAYPSSSRTGPKDWDKIGADEADDDDQGDVNLFFKKLYKNASAEQQRAMMKSFTESNGTSLSTDWDDVKGRKVETVPPEGVEAKQWK